MDKVTFLNNLENNLIFINSQIKEGKSVVKIASELGCREDNIRKWLKSDGYIRDKKTMQFVKNVAHDNKIDDVDKTNTNSNNSNLKERNNVIKTNTVRNITTNDYKSNIVETNTNNNKIEANKVIKTTTSEYNIEKSKFAEDFSMKDRINEDGIKLKDFRKLDVINQVETINKFCDDKKTLGEVVKENFAFEVDKYMLYTYSSSEVAYDRTLRKYVVLDLCLTKGENKRNNDGITKEQKEVLECLSGLNKDSIKILVSFATRLERANELFKDVDKENTEVTTVRAYSGVIDAFNRYCESEGISKKEGYSIALMSFIKNKL